MLNKLFVGREFILHDRHYVLIEHAGGDKFIAKEINQDRQFPMSAEDFAVQIFQRKLELLPDDNENDGSIQFFDASLRPVKDQERARLKKKYLESLQGLERGKKSDKNVKKLISTISRKIGDDRPPSPRTLRDWRKKYILSGCDFRSLFDRHKDKGCSDRMLHPFVFGFIEKAVKKCYTRNPNSDYKDIRKIAIKLIKVYNKDVDEINHQRLKHSKHVNIRPLLTYPSYSTVRRYVRSKSDYEIAVLRFGEARAKEMYRPILTKEKVTRPLERVEMDHSLLKFYIVDDETMLPLGFVWLTSMLDSATRTVHGFHISFDNPKYSSIMECLYHAILPKDYVHKRYPGIKNAYTNFGKPEMLYVDNGPDFTSKNLEYACNTLGIVLEYQPPYMPWYKAEVERFFGSLNTMLLNNHPGTTYLQFLHKRDKDFKPHKNAVVTLSTLLEMIHRFIIDYYHQRLHQGLEGIPASAWEEGVKDFSAELPFTNPDELLILLFPVSDEHGVSRKGIEHLNLRYNNGELQQLRARLKGQKVIFRYDPRDISMIYVYNPLDDKYLPVEAVNQEYTRGLSMHQHEVIRNFRSKKSDEKNEMALIEAEEEIYKLVGNEMVKLKIKARKTVAKFLKKKQPREKSDLEFSKDAGEILNQLEEKAAANRRENHQDSDVSDPLIEELAQEVKAGKVGAAASKPSKKAKVKRSRKPKGQKTKLEKALRIVETEKISLDDDENWGAWNA